MKDHLQFDVNKDEEDFGFSIAEDPSGIRAVIKELRPGLLAVKVKADDGSTEYAICTENMRPVYRPAKSIDELRQRFLDRR